MIGCPYEDLGSEHPEMCRLDARVIDRLIPGTAIRERWRLDGDAGCVYRVAPCACESDPGATEIILEDRDDVGGDSDGQQALVQIAHESGTKRTLFQIPENGWLASFDLLFNESTGGQFVLAYAPPPPEGEINFGFTSLYLMAVDGSEPELLLAPDVEQELFFNPTWSPDGQTIYFSHVRPIDPEAYTFATTLERLHLDTGQIDLIAESSIWPQMSPDGKLLAYVFVEATALRNKLMVAQPDGSNARELTSGEQFTAVDAPVFTPDSQFVYFSAVEATASRSWWDLLTGVQVAYAHNLPSDWYRLPVNGGEAERLTELNLVGLYGRFAPSNIPTFAFASQEGLYEMAVTGQDVTKLQEGTFTDSLAWTP
ncbi:MAG: hypothetical protein HC804_12665 [Anaerolineae bacterium]|nr:hypothetical protein [Anaerolineae bacterium]